MRRYQAACVRRGLKSSFVKFSFGLLIAVFLQPVLLIGGTSNVLKYDDGDLTHSRFRRIKTSVQSGGEQYIVKALLSARDLCTTINAVSLILLYSSCLMKSNFLKMEPFSQQRDSKRDFCGAGDGRFPNWIVYAPEVHNNELVSIFDHYLYATGTMPNTICHLLFHVTVACVSGCAIITAVVGGRQDL